ncbi:hypothetical protein [Variovorax paradoxus]|uniref:Uncharacterized protein n=2 Tax=Variovorax paradoxus TaxID=34073 RepID=A0A0H2M2Z4_VARPD|nr:hypothetical protein [Variovorax paradoxus]KLN55122.1 hypothetical protein VPARA_38110 [Variovorax paradoxus]
MEEPSVQGVGHVLSMYIDPDEILVDLNFKESTATGDAADAIAGLG